MNQQKQLEVVRHHTKRGNLKFVTRCKALPDFLETLNYRILQNQSAVVWNLNKVIPKLVDSIFSLFGKAHLVHANKQVPLCVQSLLCQPWQANWSYPMEVLYEE